MARLVLDQRGAPRQRQDIWLVIFPPAAMPISGR
jgi:hypothetical protein